MPSDEFTLVRCEECGRWFEVSGPEDDRIRRGGGETKAVCHGCWSGGWRRVSEVPDGE